ncbi:MAG: anti-sigma factor family protein [Gemmatimonadaceae bacterium]
MTRATMDCQQFDAALGDYLEDDIALPLRAAFEGHAATCARCGALVKEVRGVVQRAAALPTLLPPRDLWPGIAARLDAPVVPLSAAPNARRLRTWAALAAAAAILIAVTSVVTRQVISSNGAAVTRTLGPAMSTAAGGPGSGVAQRTDDSLGAQREAIPAPLVSNPGAPPRERVSAATTYGREIARLEILMRERRAQLDPKTAAVIEHSMRLIDSAIVEARAALARDPASRFLIGQVDQTLQKKLELMRTVALLPARA